MEIHEDKEGGGGGERTNRDQRGEGIVAGVDDEEMFEFCFDQLVNGTRDDRQKVVDYLVDEFDEMSLLDAFTEFVRRDASQDHQPSLDQECQNETSTSNPTRKSSLLAKKRSFVANEHDNEASDDTPREDNETKRDRREYFLKFWQQLKKNPLKYAKMLEQMRDYKTRRIEQITDEGKEAILERRRIKSRKYYHNLSSEKKARRFRRENELKRQKRLVSEELREKELGYNRKYRAQMTEQAKAKRRTKERERRRRKWQNMTEDERELARQKNAEGQRKQRNAKKMKKSQK